MKVLFTLLLALSMLQGSNTAKAENFEGELIALQAAIDVRDQFVTALENKDFAEITEKSMGNAIELLAQDIRTNYSDEKMARKLEKIWNQDRVLFYTASLTDLGDHAPMIPQLEDFLQSLSDKYGTIILTLPIVQDIRTLNFAIPVVFKPRGEWQSPDYDNRIEYRKHFIPFANIVTYYGTLVACNYFATKSGQPDLKKICSKAAEKLKFVMGRYIAPPISDWIFNQRNKSFSVSQSALVYTTAQELSAAIQGSH